MLLAFHQVCRYGLDGEEDESDTVGMRLGRVDCSLVWASCNELEFWSVSGRVSFLLLLACLLLLVSLSPDC